jgi:hypothetical protein
MPVFCKQALSFYDLHKGIYAVLIFYRACCMPSLAHFWFDFCNNICEKLQIMQFSYCLFYRFSLNSKHTALLIYVLLVQGGREVTVNRPIPYHNLIWITYIRPCYTSSDSLCAPWCWTNKRMRLNVLCDTSEHFWSYCAKGVFHSSVQIFVVAVATSNHSSLDNTPQRISSSLDNTPQWIVWCGNVRTKWWPWQ